MAADGLVPRHDHGQRGRAVGESRWPARLQRRRQRLGRRRVGFGGDCLRREDWDGYFIEAGQRLGEVCNMGGGRQKGGRATAAEQQERRGSSLAATAWGEGDRRGDGGQQEASQTVCVVVVKNG